jgi:hypothetical protein
VSSVKLLFGDVVGAELVGATEASGSSRIAPIGRALLRFRASEIGKLSLFPRARPCTPGINGAQAHEFLCATIGRGIEGKGGWK